MGFITVPKEAEKGVRKLLKDCDRKGLERYTPPDKKEIGGWTKGIQIGRVCDRKREAEIVKKRFTMQPIVTKEMAFLMGWDGEGGRHEE